MPDLIKLRAANEARWSAMRVTGAVTAIDATARRLVAAPAKMRYFQVSQSTGVPWFVIAVIHEREASQDWTRNIAQGDPWDRTSIHVPKGRGPFRSWSDAAVDALSFCAPYAARNKDWSAGGTLTLLESYNGLGYANKGIPSPYIWASTDQYVKGKYVADGVFDPNAVDKQIGCAALLKRMAMLDASVNFGEQQTTFPPPEVSSGDGDADVRGLQDALTAIGYPVAVDGVFGAGTEAAVKKFQRDHGLAADGAVGPATYAAIDAAKAEAAPKAAPPRTAPPQAPPKSAPTPAPVSQPASGGFFHALGRLFGLSKG